jgi:hypothetical protein
VDHEIQNGDLLSCWKEIAGYLKSSVRTCIRWERMRGLPVHRSDTAPGTRVYGFKKELDEWLRREVPPPPAGPRGNKAVSVRALMMGIIPLLILGLAFGLYIILRAKTGEPGSFSSDEFSIITSQARGKGSLRLWKAGKHGNYRTTWQISTSAHNTVMHTTIASGDIDGDGRAELAAPTAVRSTFYKGEDKYTYFGIFINFYKQGIPGIWKTTFFSRGDYVWEASDYARNEIALDNLDNDPSTEIILKTATALAVFRYDPGSQEVRLASLLNGFIKGKNLLLRSVTTARMQPGGPKILVVSANEMNPSTGVINIESGWLLFIEFGEKGLEITHCVPVDAGMCDFSLRAGDVASLGQWAVYSTAFRKKGDKYESFLLGWDLAGTKTVDILLPHSEGSIPTQALLGIGDLTFEKGDDIFIGLRPNHLLLYTWTAGALALKADYIAGPPGATICSVGFGDPDGDHYLEVVLAGGVPPADDRDGILYLEVLGYHNNTSKFFSKWRFVGGEKEEREANWIIVRRDSPRK